MDYFNKKLAKQTDKESYKKKFLHPTDLKAKTGKAIGIRPEYHQLIQVMTRTVSDETVFISDYIDNVLREHFEENKEVMQSLHQHATSVDIFSAKKK